MFVLSVGNRDGVKKTNLEKFGVDCYSKTDIFKEKFKETCLEKYGEW